MAGEMAIAAPHLSGALSQLLGAEEIGVAPRGAFARIAELFICVGKKQSGLLVARFGKHEMVQHLRDDAEFSGGKILRAFARIWSAPPM